MQTELQRQINGEPALITIDAYFDMHGDVAFDVVEVFGQDSGDKIELTSEQDKELCLTRGEQEYIVESIMDDVANDYQEVA